MNFHYEKLIEISAVKYWLEMRCFVVLAILCIVYPVENANILFVTTYPSYSHQLVFQPIWKELSLRGHKVTVITPNPLKDKSLTNLTEIDTSFLHEERGRISKAVLQYMKKPGFAITFIKDKFASQGFSSIHESILEKPEVQELINGDHKFDVVIAEWLYSTLGAFSSKFNCPLIGITSLGASIVSLDTVGNPSHPIFAPDHHLPVGRELSLKDRILSTLYSIYSRLYYHWVVLPREDKLVKKYFGEEMPYMGDIERNISILLLNRNPVFHRVIPVVPAVIELGNVRNQQKPHPLNKELKTFLDNSVNGVVYFSLGSNTYSEDLREDVRDEFIAAFSDLPYNVVWKWEKDVLPGKPKNVFIQKWIPQAALLGHPNVKGFITQGGLQSMEETIANHVPVIGIPLHSDQIFNVDAAVKLGFAIELDCEFVNAKTLRNAIIQIMENGSYTENIKKVDSFMNDRPLEGLQRAIWWIEYVIRHKGAKHLRSPSMDIPWYQYLLLDVISIIGFTLLFLCYITYKITKTSIRLLKRFIRKLLKLKNE